MQRATPKKKYSKSLVLQKTVLYLIKSNGKRNKPNDKQKTISKNELKNRIKKAETKTSKERNKRVFLLETFFCTLEKQKTSVRFGAIKEGVKQPHHTELQTNVARRNGKVRVL
jgi:hypothetical protein